MIRLLEDVVDDLMAAMGDRARITQLLYSTVSERVSVMHERAQRAEGRAMKAEKLLERISLQVGSGTVVVGEASGPTVQERSARMISD